MKIDLHNYEEWMVAFVDNELNEKEVAEFQTFLKNHPNLKEELAAFEEVQFQPDKHIIFENKKSLSRSEGALYYIKKMWPFVAIITLAIFLWPSGKQDQIAETITTQEATEAKQTPQKNKNQSIPEPSQKTAIQARAKNKAKALPPSNTTKSTTPVIRANDNAHKVDVQPKPVKQEYKRNAIKESEGVIKATPANQYTKVPTIPTLPKTTSNKEELIEPLANKQEQAAQEQLEQTNPETPAPKKSTAKQAVQNNESEHALVVINEVTHPQLYKKINQVIDQVEENIETVKELKKQTITIRIGNKKIITINK